MSWWQTLLVSVVPVLITLIVTNWAESKRRLKDAEERDLDRQTQERQRDADRAAAERASWRDDKRRVHQEVLSYARWLRFHTDSIAAYVGLAERAHDTRYPVITPGIQADLDKAKSLSQELNGVGARLDELIVSVEVHCSLEAIQVMKEFYYDFIGVLKCMHEVTEGRGLELNKGGNYYLRYREQMHSVEQFVEFQYPAVIRRDLHPDA